MVHIVDFGTWTSKQITLRSMSKDLVEHDNMVAFHGVLVVLDLEAA